jgi:gliding motility-associated-like protein
LKTTLTSWARKPLLIFLLFISLNSFGQSPLSTVGTDDCDCEFFIPNSFSPNGDESNDNLHIKHECIFDDFEFRIYNRWGEVIFTAYDPDFIWQGTNGLGELVQFGTYVWKARYRLADDIERVHVKERTGHINVIR